MMNRGHCVQENVYDEETPLGARVGMRRSEDPDEGGYFLTMLIDSPYGTRKAEVLMSEENMQELLEYLEQEVGWMKELDFTQDGNDARDRW